MSAHAMLEQLLNSGLSLLGQGAQPGGPAAAPAPEWRKFATGTAVGGALGLLLGSKRGRKMGGTVLKVGGVAALGAMAYRAYTQWQAQQASQSASPAGGALWQGASSQAPRTVDLLPPPEVEQHSRALLVAMIGAAKSDGHLDERERGLLEAELARTEADPAQRRWVEEEVRRPLDPAAVARAATTPELAAEMYLASLLVSDETSFMERAYLDELARQLRLPDGLQTALRAQAATA